MVEAENLVSRRRSSCKRGPRKLFTAKGMVPSHRDRIEIPPPVKDTYSDDDLECASHSSSGSSSVSDESLNPHELTFASTPELASLSDDMESTLQMGCMDGLFLGNTAADQRGYATVKKRGPSAVKEAFKMNLPVPSMDFMDRLAPTESDLESAMGHLNCQAPNGLRNFDSAMGQVNCKNPLDRRCDLSMENSYRPVEDGVFKVKMNPEFEFLSGADPPNFKSLLSLSEASSEEDCDLLLREENLPVPLRPVPELGPTHTPFQHLQGSPYGVPHGVPPAYGVPPGVPPAYGVPPGAPPAFLPSYEPLPGQIVIQEQPTFGGESCLSFEVFPAGSGLGSMRHRGHRTHDKHQSYRHPGHGAFSKPLLSEDSNDSETVASHSSNFSEGSESEGDPKISPTDNRSRPHPIGLTGAPAVASSQRKAELAPNPWLATSNVDIDDDVCPSFDEGPGTPSARKLDSRQSVPLREPFTPRGTEDANGRRSQGKDESNKSCEAAEIQGCSSDLSACDSVATDIAIMPNKPIQKKKEPRVSTEDQMRSRSESTDNGVSTVSSDSDKILEDLSCMEEPLGRRVERQPRKSSGKQSARMKTKQVERERPAARYQPGAETASGKRIESVKTPINSEQRRKPLEGRMANASSTELVSEKGKTSEPGREPDSFDSLLGANENTEEPQVQVPKTPKGKKSSRDPEPSLDMADENNRPDELPEEARKGVPSGRPRLSVDTSADALKPLARASPNNRKVLTPLGRSNISTPSKKTTKGDQVDSQTAKLLEKRTPTSREIPFSLDSSTEIPVSPRNDEWYSPKANAGAKSGIGTPKFAPAASFDSGETEFFEAAMN